MVPLDAPTAACADRLDMVDAAYARPGGPEAEALKARYCPTCPLALACLTEAMLRHEEGIWGATTANQRTKHGGPPTASTALARRARARARAA